jgi:hypothetical protein
LALTLTTFAPSISSGSPVWTIAFSGTEQLSGDLAVTETTGILAVTIAVGELAVSTTTI